MAKKKHTGDIKRLNVICSPKQEEIINEAVENAKAPDRSTWMLAHIMRAATKSGGDDHAILLSGELVQRVRRIADQQGITPEQLIAQLVIAA